MQEEPPSCVLLADRHHGPRRACAGLQTAFGTVVMVADTPSLLEGAGRLRPDMAVVDLPLSGDGGLEWLHALRLRCPGLKVIVLSVHDEQAVRQAALQAGADAFVLKRAIATDCFPPSSSFAASQPWSLRRRDLRNEGHHRWRSGGRRILCGTPASVG